MQYAALTPRVASFNSATDFLPITHHFPSLTAPPDLVALWDFTSDPTTSTSLTITRDPLGRPIEQRLRAEVWTHDASGVCQGPRIRTTCPPTYERRLASHYTGQNFQWLLAEQPLVPPPMRQSPIPWPVPEAICPVCAASFPGSYIALDPCLALGTCALPVWKVRIGALEIDGTAAISPLASAELALAHHFVVPSEPIGTLYPEAVRLVGLDAALQPTLALVANGASMTQLGEGGQKLQAPGDPPGVVLYGNLHQLLRIGGDLSNTITTMDLDSGTTWDAFMTGDRPIDIAAAAGAVDYSEILVVERRHEEHAPAMCEHDRGECEREGHSRSRRQCEAHGHTADRMQLVLADIAHQSFTRLVSLPRSGRYDAWWLVALPEGSYALVASSTAHDDHAVARLVLSPRAHGGSLDVQVAAIARGAGAVLAPPIGSLRGVSVAVNGGPAGWQTIGYAIEDLRDRGRGRASGRLEDLF